MPSESNIGFSLCRLSTTGFSLWQWLTGYARIQNPLQGKNDLICTTN
jgi:hypothetical protein